MPDTIETLLEQMDAAARELDFEQAKQLRDRINLMRGGATATDTAQVETAGIVRQQPGAMGLGTSQQRVSPPEDWTPPVKPDPLTKGRGRRRR